MVLKFPNSKCEQCYDTGAKQHEVTKLFVRCDCEAGRYCPREHISKMNSIPNLMEMARQRKKDE